MRGLNRLATLACLLVVASADHAGAETPWSRLYHRTAATPTDVVRYLDTRSLTEGADGALVVFDIPSFCSPPYFHEWKGFNMDGELWLRAVGSWAIRRAERAAGSEKKSKVSVATDPDAGPLHVATTLSKRPVRVGESGWREQLLADLGRKWWEDPSFRSFVPARIWMDRLLSGVPGRRRMLVLVTSEIPPERLADHSHGHRSGTEKWRKKLLPVGAYWDEEAIGKRLVENNVVLEVVAPEARFCDFWPLQEIPELPWVSRPTIGLPPGAAEHWQKTRESLEDLKPEDKARLLDWAGYRFDSHLPFDAGGRFGSYAFFNTDCPSGFGYWPFVRAAAVTGGSYVFYPFPPVNFRDACPYDPGLLRELAPKTSSRADIVKGRSRDTALGALIRASRIVLPVTAWLSGPRRSSGWSGYASVDPPRHEHIHRERDKPIDDIGLVEYSANVVARQGRQLVDVVKTYDQAIAILDETQRGIESGAVERPHRRSMANLRLGRYWFEMSAFHLEALSIYKREIKKHVAEAVALGIWQKKFCIRAVPAIRLSDCLEGYEGKSISAKRELELRAGVPGVAIAEGKRQPRVPDQSNFLPKHPYVDYRTMRDPLEVTLNLDPRLRRRALRVIRAGRQVMKNEGRSPWGWMVYYSCLHTFILLTDDAAPSGESIKDRQKESTPTSPGGSTTPSPGKASGPASGK